MPREREDIEHDIEELSARLDGQNDTPSKPDIYRALDLLKEVEVYLGHSIAESGMKCESKSNVVVLGPSGAGKSTAVSFLFGTGRLNVRHQGRLSRVLVADPPLQGVEIRGGAISMTLLPVVNHVRLQSGMIAVWDMPGCRDTRGPFAELVVHFIYKWLLKSEENLRFLLVSPPLHERLQRATLQDLINGSLIREDNAVLVCMKCATDFYPRTAADLDLDSIDESKAKIPTFPLPAPIQSNPDGHDYSAQYARRKNDILTALGNLHSHPAEYNKALPDAAVLLLGQMTTACVTVAQDRLSAIFLEECNWESYFDDFDEIAFTLDELQSGDRMTLETAVDTLTRVVTGGSRFQHDEDLHNASERLFTLSILNGRGHLCNLSNWLSPNANFTLEIAKAKLVGLKNAVEAYYHSEKHRGTPNTLVVSAFDLRLSDEQAMIDKFVKKREMAIDRVEAIPNVILIGFASLNVDVGLRMWANVALVSPTIRVTTEEVFNLTAVGQAASAQKYNENAGEDGLHGTPGLPGGNLLVVCDDLRDGAQMLRATLSSGQRGGDAQNGGDGIDGADSEYDRATLLDAIKTEIKRGLLAKAGKKLPRELKGGLLLTEFDQVDSPLSGMSYGTPGRRDLIIVKDPEPGNPRLPAGSGGRGGAGGKGGVVLIRSARQGDWEATGSIGPHGLDGKEGAASRDGFSSPSFTATVQQWYSKGGWRGTHFSEPKIEVSAEPMGPEEQPVLVPATPSTEDASESVNNTGLGLGFVQGKYRDQFEKLETKFLNCIFNEPTVKWA